MIQTIYNVFAAVHGDSLALRMGRNRLRILGYHAVCEDHLTNEKWVPPYFVTRAAFEKQLRYLRQHTCVLPLREALSRWRSNDLPERCVALTFDDGYANNLHFALPLLRKYDLPATIFLTTQYVESGELFHYDRIQLLRWIEGESQQTEDYWLGYRSDPLDAVLERLDVRWRKVKDRVSPEQYAALRPLRPSELGAFDPRLIDFGAHTDRHPVLGNESAVTRELEIATSIKKVSQWTDRQIQVFSYPNGDWGDFGELDKQVLRSNGIEAALTTIPGSNRLGCDPFELRRYSVGLYHSRSAFIAEASGFRTFLISLAGKTQAS